MQRSTHGISLLLNTDMPKAFCRGALKDWGTLARGRSLARNFALIWLEYSNTPGHEAPGCRERGLLGPF